MGAGQSTNAQAPSTTYALHILRVTPGSPASQTSIEAFFDFIVGFNGKHSFSGDADLDAAELERIVEEHENRVLDLLVWSGKTRETRVIPIVPSRGWALAQQAAALPDDSDVPAQPSLLGLSMRMCEFEGAMDNVWHVLEVLEGSPAESAGLVPYGDWIIGWSGGVLAAENDFYDVVEAHIDKPLRVYVYSYDFDNLREVVLVPNRHWGGEGLLGCVFGFGYIHRIPSQSVDRKQGSALPDVQEQEDREAFIPADASRVTPAAESGKSSFDRPHQHPVMAHPRPTRLNETSHGGPRRSTLTPGSSTRTPPVGRSGSFLNGNGATSPGLYSLGHGSTSAATITHSNNTARGGRERGGANIYDDVDTSDDGNEDEDGTVSVSGTDATDFGSLTSVE
ncbi:GRASP55/65 PDZ-like domain-containing protein [Scleroderma yunnanense]